jgi:hypothetical protein
MRDAKAIGKHWWLVFVAYWLLHLDCLHLPLAKEQALIELLILQAHQMIQNGNDTKSVFDFLLSKQQALCVA